MPRPVMERIVGSDITKRGFRPSDARAGETEEIILALDEAEALRLADLEGLYQQAAAQRMGVSRQTFGRIVESARKKTADALLNGKKLRIEGGIVAVERPGRRPTTIAVPTTARGLVEAHFGASERFTIYTLDAEGRAQAEERIEASIGPGCKSGGAPRLAAMGVSVLIAGRIGEGAVHVFNAHGIEVIRGASGSARAAAQSFADGELGDSGEACRGGCREQGRGCR
jgi:predicted DNA-binding protein (UPF0251 family)/predicted Fe-Mo cluster-binding NifX family protein